MSVIFSRRTLRNCLVAAAIGAIAPAALADSLDELRAAVGANDAATAWPMAQRMELENSGDPEFDFWYGLAAKAAGKKNQALFAFERVVLAQPDNPRAKLELADVHYQFGNTTEARKFFNEVLEGNPPEPVQQRIRTYLSAIDAKDQQKGARISYVLGLAAGHDSNISSATDIAVHNTFMGASTLTLNPVSLAAEAAFLEARAGVDIVAPVNQRTLRFLSLSAQRRDNDEVFSGGNFDNSQLSVSAGWMLNRGSVMWRIPVGIQALWAESESVGIADDDRFMFTVGAEYSRSLSARTGVNWFGRLGESHYPSGPDRNTYLVMLGAGYNWQAESAPVTVSASTHVGWEPVKEDTLLAKQTERDHYAAWRLNVRWTVASGQALYAALGAQRTLYRQKAAIDPGWSPDRKDLLTDLSLGWQWQIDRKWAVNLDASTLKNDYQFALFDFDRTQVKLGSTWRF